MQSFIDKAYSNLVDAIVMQAAIDYCNALNGYGYDDYSPAYIIKDVETFFYSEYFAMITKMNPEYLIRKIKQHKSKTKIIKRGN